MTTRRFGPGRFGPGRIDAGRVGPGRGGRGRVVAGMLAAGLLGACATGDTDAAGAVPASAATAAAVRAPSVEIDPDAATGVLDADEEVLPAGHLRLMLEQLLGEHVLLVSGAAADHAEGLPTDEALAVVADNTDRLTEAIALVYGDVGARAFASLWSQHVAFFLDLARGSADGDGAVVDEAMDHLHHYEQGFGSFTQTATEGALPADTVAQLLAVHVEDIDAYLRARLDGDAERVATVLARGHDEAAGIGAALAAAIASQGPVAFPGDAEAQRVVRASGLARAFAAHIAAHATDAQQAPDAARAASAAVESALRTTVPDPADAGAAIDAWRRLTAGPVVDVGAGDMGADVDAGVDDGVGAEVDAAVVAAALGVGDRGADLRTIAGVAPGSPARAEVLEAHRVAYDLAAAWLG